MRRKITALLCALTMTAGLMVLPAQAANTAGTACAATQNVEVDGQAVEFQMYALLDVNGYSTNYAKLRDVAYVLNGTSAQFEVRYDNGTISITTGAAYTETGSEMKTPFSGDRAYTGGPQVVKVNGQEVSMDAIVLTDDQGGGYTYFKLRDLGASLGFTVEWDAQRSIVTVATGTGSNANDNNTSNDDDDDWWWLWWWGYEGDDPLLWPGENDAKHLRLFGDENKRRFESKAEAEANMVTVTIPVWTLKKDGSKASGTKALKIHQALADEVVEIFTEIYNDPEQFPISSVGGYSWRGDTATGEHNCGTAIDINPDANYQVRDGQALVGTHWTPGEDPLSIPENGSVVRIFRTHGWDWGGDAWAWDSDPSEGYHDYMHLSYMGK